MIIHNNMKYLLPCNHKSELKEAPIHCGNDAYIKTWIAECEVCGALYRYDKLKEHLEKK